jgi:hypothetical protein
VFPYLLFLVTAAAEPGDFFRLPKPWFVLIKDSSLENEQDCPVSLVARTSPSLISHGTGRDCATG